MKILIVVDMQNDFLTGSLKTKDATEIIPKIKKVVEEYKKNGMPVIFTKDTHTDSYLLTQEGKALPVIHCIKNTYGWEICDELKNINYGEVFEKNTFGSIELFENLKKQYNSNIDEITFCGVCTDICVVSNAIIAKAYFPEVKIVILEDCTKGVTEESHLSALSTLKSCQCIIRKEC